jgi:hypothetical protein
MSIVRKTISSVHSISAALSIAVILPLFLTAVCAAQEETSPAVKTFQNTPEVLALIGESNSLAAGIENKEDKISALFQILSLELRLPEKDAAKKTLQQIKELLPSVEKETVQNQIRSALVFAMQETGDKDGAVALASENPAVAGRSEMLLNIAERIIEDNKKNKSKTDVIPILQKVIAGAVEVKDSGLEAAASAILGSEFAKQGKPEQAKASFVQARNKSKELEEIEEREITALIVRLQLENNMLTESYALIESLPADKKPLFYGLAAVVLSKEGGNEDSKERNAGEAEKILNLLEAGDVKDNAMMGIAKETADTISVEKLTQFINSVSKTERKMYFLNTLVPLLVQKGRFEDVKKLSLLADKPDEIMAATNISRIEALTKEKKFDEADKSAAAISDAQLKQAVLRHIILERIKNGDAENGAVLAENVLTDEEKKASSELLSQLPKVTEITEPSERTAMYHEILESQLGLFDIKGAKETIALMVKNTASLKAPVERIVHQLALAGAQADLNDKPGAAGNLRSLVQFLAEIKDITVLKGLVPEEKPETANPADNPAAITGNNQLILDLKKPVSEEDIREKLIEVYLSVSDVQARIGSFDEGKKTLSAAKQQIELLKDSAKKIPLLLLSAQMASEFETEKNKK